MKHTVVYQEENVYAGWPANHGAWQWGDEFLVGFMRGAYDRTNAGHKIYQPYELGQARSLDGGETWSFEKTDLPIDIFEAKDAPDFSLSDTIIRVRGSYDTGGEVIPDRGVFMLSKDRGKTWQGPYWLDKFDAFHNEDEWITARTCTYGELVFLSVAKIEQWGSDYVFCVRASGGEFEYVGEVCRDDARAVMPSVVVLGSIIYAALRRKVGRKCWIDVFCSEDGARNWYHHSKVADTGGRNGNPPALGVVNGQLICVYAHRNKQAMMLSVHGHTGWDHRVLRGNGDRDIGYPQLFQREDGDWVAVYYWAEPLGVQYIASTLLEL